MTKAKTFFSSWLVIMAMLVGLMFAAVAAQAHNSGFSTHNYTTVAIASYEYHMQVLDIDCTMYQSSTDVRMKNKTFNTSSVLDLTNRAYLHSGAWTQRTWYNGGGSGTKYFYFDTNQGEIDWWHSWLSDIAWNDTLYGRWVTANYCGT